MRTVKVHADLPSAAKIARNAFRRSASRDVHRWRHGVNTATLAALGVRSALHTAAANRTRRAHLRATLSVAQALDSVSMRSVATLNRSVAECVALVAKVAMATSVKPVP